MAIDICSENISSPRISFSHDLKETNFIEPNINTSRSNALLLNPTIDFDFVKNLSQNLSSADEIFANGKILPLQIKKIDTHKPNSSHIENPNDNTPKKRLIEFLSTNFDTEEDEEEEEEKPQPKPFWQFRRSSSLNIENGRSNNGLIRSLQFLTRSNSTGSAPNQKPKAIQKQSSLKEGSVYRTNSSNQDQSFKHYCYNDDKSKRAYLKKSTSTNRSYGNGVRISPVLNIPPSYIAKGTVSLFGIGSLFCSKKSKKKKK